MPAGPQALHLAMRRPLLGELPDPTPRPPYELRVLRDGDGPAWRRVTLDALGREAAPPPEIEPLPSGRSLVWLGEVAVGAAAACRHVCLAEEVGYLGMLAVRQTHRRRGLGRSLVAACLRQMRDQGRRAAALDTEPRRLDAISLFLGLGFLPDPENEAERRRWADTLGRLGRGDLAAGLRSRRL